MPFFFVRQDITKMHVDAIVNAANGTLLGGGGVDGAIHRAAGPRLVQECATLGGCRTGEAKRTLAYDLPCKYVIHTVGPVWYGGSHDEARLLSDCYRNSLRIAADSGCESVAFPLISSGVYGYPKDQAIRVAVETIRAFLQKHDLTVYLVLYDSMAIRTQGERFGELRRMLDNLERVGRPEQTAPSAPGRKFGFAKPARARGAEKARPIRQEAQQDDAEAQVFAADACEAPLPCAASEASLEDLLGQLDESFAQMLFRLIDERGMTDAECYKKANIDRKLFSKIRGNVHYRPSKMTALAFAIALELSLDETRELLGKAGYALSHSYKADLIVEYFIGRGVYDVMEINEALFAFDQALLGA